VAAARPTKITVPRGYLRADAEGRTALFGDGSKPLSTGGAVSSSRAIDMLDPLSVAARHG
jgi:hypothetical protein